MRLRASKPQVRAGRSLMASCQHMAERTLSKTACQTGVVGLAGAQAPSVTEAVASSMHLCGGSSSRGTDQYLRGHQHCVLFCLVYTNDHPFGMHVTNTSCSQT